MRGFWPDALKVGDQIGVERELQNMFGVGLALQLGIDNLVGPASEVGRALHPFEKVGIAAPCAAEQCALEDDVRAGRHRFAREPD